MPRVTVIDDDSDFLDVLGELLETDGYEVNARTAAVARIEEIAETRPDLVIIDLGLQTRHEELTGLQTVHAARTNAQLREVPIIVCTADAIGLEAVWPDLMLRGDVHQLMKPFDLRTFERVVATATGMAPRVSASVALGVIDSAVEIRREA